MLAPADSPAPRPACIRARAALARSDAEALARAVGRSSGKALDGRFSALARQAGLARATLTAGTRTLASVGGTGAIAPGSAVLVRPGTAGRMTVTASEITASQYTRELSGSGVEVVLRSGPKILSASMPLSTGASHADTGNVTVDGTGYRAVTQTFGGFGNAPVTRHHAVRFVGNECHARRQSGGCRRADRRLLATGARFFGACLAGAAGAAAQVSSGRPSSRRW